MPLHESITTYRDEWTTLDGVHYSGYDHPIIMDNAEQSFVEERSRPQMIEIPPQNWVTRQENFPVEFRDGIINGTTPPIEQIQSTFQSTEYIDMETHLRRTMEYLRQNNRYSDIEELKRQLLDKDVVENVKKPKEITNFLPKRNTKLREWSISCRTLKTLLADVARTYAYHDDIILYKFKAIYDSKYKLFRVWNVKTNNVICTVKAVSGKYIIRYRANSHYALMLRHLDNINGNRSIKVIESTNLGLHRGELYDIEYVKEDMEKSLIRFRKSRLNKKLEGRN